MTALVRGHRGGRHVGLGIYGLAQVDGLVGRIEIVGELPRSGGDLHVADAVGLQHPHGHLPAGHAVQERRLRRLLEFFLKRGLHHITEYRDPDEQNPI